MTGDSRGRVIPPGLELTALQCVRDGIAYQSIRATPGAREQIGLYRALARELGFKAEGMSGAELAARRTAAAAALGDFERWLAGEIVQYDWQSWALRLAAELGSVLTGLDRLPGAEL